MAFVYWIHLPEHSDPFSEGYVGVTVRSVERRYKDHVSYAIKGTYPISHAIKKYGDKLVVDTLVDASEDYCYELEQKLRPNEKIGWNLVKGGSKPPSRQGYKHSDEVKKKISEASIKNKHTENKLKAYAKRKGVKRSEESKRRMREAIKDRKPWETSRAVTEIWSSADKLYKLWAENGKPGAINLAKIFGTKCCLIALVKHFKSGWVPENDSKWLQWARNLNK